MGAGSGADGSGAPAPRPARLDPEWVQVCERVGEDLTLRSGEARRGAGRQDLRLCTRGESFGDGGRDEASEAGLALKESPAEAGPCGWAASSVRFPAGLG